MDKTLHFISYLHGSLATLKTMDEMFVSLMGPKDTISLGALRNILGHLIDQTERELEAKEKAVK